MTTHSMDRPKKRSWRHHYIPEFFIDGFTADDGKLFVFDKNKGEILSIKQAPKQVFFRPDDNTSIVNGQEIDAAEKIFQRFDSDFSKELRYLRSSSDDFDFDGGSAYVQLRAFMWTQFFRHPKNEDIYNKLYDQTSFTWNGNHNGSEDLRKVLDNASDTHRKMNKAILPFLLFKQTLENNEASGTIKAFSSPRDLLVLGDSPAVYINIINEDIDLLGPSMMPINSRRLFMMNNGPIFGDTSTMMAISNVCAIEEAQRLVVASDRLVLQTAIDLWKKLRALAPMTYWKPIIFNQTISETIDRRIATE